MRCPETFKKEGSHAGTLGWAAIGAFVVAWDVLAPETLTSAAHRAVSHPIGKYVVGIGAGILVGHLFDMPSRYGTPDVISATSDFVNKKLGTVT